MDRCHLKGETGDRLHAVLCAAGYNIRWLLRMIAKKGLLALLGASFAPVAAGQGWGDIAQARHDTLATGARMNISGTTRSCPQHRSLVWGPFNLINCNLCDSNQLYAIRTTAAEAAAMTAEPWVSVDQIAEHLGVMHDSIYQWIDRKHLPAHRVCRLWKFKVTEVDEWVRAGGADEKKKSD